MIANGTLLPRECVRCTRWLDNSSLTFTCRVHRWLEAKETLRAATDSSDNSTTAVV